MSTEEFENDFEDDDNEDLIIIDDDEEENDKLEGDEDNIDTIDEDEFESESENENEDDEKKEDEDDIDILDITELKDKVKLKKVNITVPFITKYEYPKIIAIRAQQIANGSPIFIDITNLKIKKPMNIAELEFKKGKLDNIMIKRILPNGIIEYRKISDLKFYEFY